MGTLERHLCAIPALEVSHCIAVASEDKAVRQLIGKHRIDTFRWRRTPEIAPVVCLGVDGAGVPVPVIIGNMDILPVLAHHESVHLHDFSQCILPAHGNRYTGCAALVLYFFVREEYLRHYIYVQE